MPVILEIFLVTCTCLFLLSLSYVAYCVAVEYLDERKYVGVIGSIRAAVKALDEEYTVETLPKEEVLLLLEKLIRREYIDWDKWKAIHTFEEE